MRIRMFLAATAAVLTLAACESSKEKAEKHYQSAMDFIEQGDPARAEVELKNVFRFDGSHYEARKELAKLLEEKGDIRGAYSQLLRLAEQYPEDAPVRRELTQLAIEIGNWDEAERHGRLAAQLDSANEEQQDLNIALDYRKAMLAKDDQARAAVIVRAEERLVAHPDDVIALRVIISDKVEGTDPQDAIPYVDRLIAAEPTKFEAWMLKLGLLAQGSDDAATEAHLNKMIDTFPDNPDVRVTQAAWFVDRGELDKAENTLREIAAAAGDGSAENLALVKFIEQNRGPDAALTEAEKLAAAAADTPADRQLYDSLRAFYRFNAGERDEAMAIMAKTLEDAQASDQTNRLRAMLAGMRLKTGDRAGADTLVQEVLTADATNVFALRVRAEALLAEDKTDAAIIELRRALDQDPRDIETLALLAQAYGRAGNRQLMGETLASAVDISGAAPDQSLQYAAFLLQDNRRGPARAVLDDALRVSPRNVDLLVQAAQMAIQDQADTQAASLLATLEQIEGDPRATSAAQALRAEMMMRQGRMDEGVAMLEQRAEEAGGNAAAVIQVIRARIATGQIIEARQYLDQMMAASPDDPDLKLANASLLISERKPDEAETVMREVIASHPQSPGPVQQLYGLLLALGQEEEAQTLLDEALARMPENPALSVVQAGAKERAGQIDEAIAIYEKLYAADNSNVILANNLASLLATWRGDDPASLARATAAAQRLQDTQVPAFQDTYGWILHLNGNSAGARPYLERAAAGMPDDPIVQYHLGIVQAATSRTEDAKSSLTRALELAGDRDLPQMDLARAKLAELGAAGPETGDTAPATDAPTPIDPLTPAVETDTAAPSIAPEVEETVPANNP